MEQEIAVKEKHISNLMVNMQFFPELVEDSANITSCKKIPLSRIADIGVAFEPLAAAVQNFWSASEKNTAVLNTAISNMPDPTDGTSMLFRAIIPEGKYLASAKDGSGYLGALLDEKGLAGQARFIPVTETVQVVEQAPIPSLVCNPAMIFMAAALTNIDQKLDKIQETQQEMLDFLVQKEKSALRGDLRVLEDILNNYKYNWNNEMYKKGNHQKVLDVKQNAERGIDFHQEQIKTKLDKKSVLHGTRDVQKQIAQMRDYFKDYQLSLYLYAFSSFLEVMLLENFTAGYLNSVTDKIERYSLQYRELYTRCYNQLEHSSQSSIQQQFLGGLADVSKLAGETIAKIPVISKSQIDENLIDAGKKLGKMGEEKTSQTMRKLLDRQSACVWPFIENINTVKRLYEQPLELFFDKENIYLNVDMVV